MKAIKQYKPLTWSNSVMLKLQMLTLCALAFESGTHAQQVVVTPPVVPATSQTISDLGSDTNEVNNATGSAAPVSASTAHQNRNPFQWGPVTLHPRINYGFTYGTGFQSQPGDPHKTAINTVTPGIGFDLGKHWQLGYSAAATFYSDPNFHNSVDHSVTLTGNTAYEDWTFNLLQSCALSSDPQVQTARQTDQQTYATSFGATYQISSGLSLQLGVSQNFLVVNEPTNTSPAGGTTNSPFTSGLTGSRSWSTLENLNYQCGPNLSAGVGGGFGYTDVDQGIDMMNEQVQGQISYQVARKIRLSINAGYQFNQFINSTQPGLNTPTFGVSMSYRPFETTTISLSASRSVSASSYFVNQVTETTGFNAGINQRLFRKLNLGLSGGYVNTSYKSSISIFGTSVSLASRDDNYSFFSASLSTTFLKRGTASLSYSRSQNSSSLGKFGYSSDQIGFQLGYSY